MPDLLSATQAGVFAALAAGRPTGWDVWDTVPEGTQPNFVKIGTISQMNEGAKAGGLERFTVEVQTIYRGEDRTVMTAAMWAVRCAIDPDEGAPPLAFDGVEFGGVRFLDAHASDAAADGVTYAGISNFELYAEPA